MALASQNQQFIRKTFELAKLGEGKVSPNPLVGAVIVKNGKILATGYHESFGSAHAERAAILKLAKKKPIKNCALGTTLYVSLEPCNHYGKTPPCTDIIIEAGIKRVYFGVHDPHPLVAKNNSLKILRIAGVEVFGPVLEQEAKLLNRIFLKNVLRQEPYYILKTAQSQDRRMISVLTTSTCGYHSTMMFG
ncbi:Riboflavin biosynthesis protein ribD [sediment metagenome]|uniref:diaminohydroxyphosphoribosylaminopyrimidine deaminase n=1 Tax=sediment metagenome TaxID=749907 RepID=D9PMC4_9ZZZZ